MSVRSAVAEVEKEPRQDVARLVSLSIQRQGAGLRAVLPSHVEPDRFQRLILSAIKSTPRLLDCWRTEQGELSVLLSAMKAAMIGLEPNTPTEEAWLLPRKNQGIDECRLSIGYKGLLKLARRSGEIKTIFPGVVYEGDVFRWARGLEADLFEHVSCDEDDPAKLTHAYAVVRYVNGGVDFEVLTRRRIESKHRASSDSWKSQTSRPYSPWTTQTEAMWKKTALRVLSARLPLTSELASALAADDRPLTLTDEGVIPAFIEGEREPQAIEQASTLTGEDVAALAPEPISGR